MRIDNLLLSKVAEKWVYAPHVRFYFKSSPTDRAWFLKRIRDENQRYVLDVGMWSIITLSRESWHPLLAH